MRIKTNKQKEKKIILNRVTSETIVLECTAFPNFLYEREVIFCFR